MHLDLEKSWSNRVVVDGDTIFIRIGNHYTLDFSLKLSQLKHNG